MLPDSLPFYLLKFIKDSEEHRLTLIKEFIKSAKENIEVLREIISECIF